MRIRTILVAFSVTALLAATPYASLSSASGAVQRQAVDPGTIRASIKNDGHQVLNINGRFSRPSLDANGDVVAFDSIASRLVADDTNKDADVFVRNVTTGTTTRISVSSEGTQGNRDSQRPDVSGDGNLVVFDSSATNLVPGRDTNGQLDVFVHNMTTGTTRLVSQSLGGGPGDAGSFQPVISHNGRWVAFTSDAKDLVRQDVSGARDIYIRDLRNGFTSVVSLNALGEPAGVAANSPSISAGGRYIAFSSFGNGLVDGDTNDAFDVFVRDRVLGTTTRVSVDSTGGQSDGSSSSNPSISNNGDIVTFSSDATNLVAGDTNAVRDIFAHDMTTGATTRVSVGPGGIEADGQSDGPGIRGGLSWGPTISGSGRYVAFDSIATNLVDDDTNTCSFRGGQDYSVPGQCPDIFVYDRTDQTTTLVSVSSTGEQGDSSSTDPAISDDGHHVAFFSAAANLVANDTNTCLPFFTLLGTCPDIFLHTD